MSGFGDLSEHEEAALFALAGVAAIALLGMIGLWPAPAYTARWSMVAWLGTYLGWADQQHSTTDMTDTEPRTMESAHKQSGDDTCPSCGSELEKIGEVGETDGLLCRPCNTVYEVE